MGNDILFSVITINFNNKEGLQKTLQSVIRQTYKGYEYIIIDGGSTDGSKETIENNSSHLTYWVSEPDKGIYNAMNKGVEHATGEYCIFMNSGDCFANEKVLETVATEAISRKEDYYSGITLFSLNGKILKKKTNPPKSVTLKNTFTSTLNHQSTFMRRSILVDMPYNEDYKIISDGLHFMQSIVFNNATYKALYTDVAIFDIGGISRINIELEEKEYNDIIQKYIPPKILEDYLLFFNPQETIMLSQKEHPILFKVFSLAKKLKRVLKTIRKSQL